MAEKIEFYFSSTMSGMVWKTVADAERRRLFLEVRDHQLKQVSFFALELDSREWLWKNFITDEPWWVTLVAVSDDRMFFTVYSDVNNPDKKSLLAYDIVSRKLAWWKNDFAISAVTGQIVTGVETKFGAKEIGLDATNGKALARDTLVSGVEQNFRVIQPFHYYQGTPHFETVKSFLERKTGISPVAAVEYVEYGSIVAISAFTGEEDLANYLFVFNSTGEILIKETLGEHLKGIAFHTFFILAPYLIFVKNKRELISYKII